MTTVYLKQMTVVPLCFPRCNPKEGVSRSQLSELICKVEISTTKADMWALGVVTWDCYVRTHRSLFVPDPKVLVQNTKNLEEALTRFHLHWTGRTSDMHIKEDIIAGAVFRRTFQLEKDRCTAVSLYRDLKVPMSKTIETLQEPELAIS